MSILFLDTSVALKLYLREVGSSWLQTRIQGNQIAVSELVFYEFATVLRRRWLEGSLIITEVVSLYERVVYDSQNWDVLRLAVDHQLDRLIDITRHVPASYRVRALDGIHLAAAEIAQEAANGLTPPEPFVFVSADKQLLQVAQVRSFAVENPEDHP